MPNSTITVLFIHNKVSEALSALEASPLLLMESKPQDVVVARTKHKISMPFWQNMNQPI